MDQILQSQFGEIERTEPCRLLLIEDHLPLLQSLQRGLSEEGYEVAAATTAGEAEERLQSGGFDVILLDRMLPGGDGLTLLGRWRAAGLRTPVLVITARDAVADRIEGLDRGADDYLVKPFSFGELLARVRAALRRSLPAHGGRLVVDDLELDLLTRRAARRGVELDLTPRQFELLAYLMRHAGHTVSRTMIARDVWNETTATWTNVIEVQINRLRRKLGSPDRPLLHTIRGEGYLLGDPP